MHTERAAYAIGASRASVWCESWSLAVSVGGDTGFGLEPGAHSDSCPGGVLIPVATLVVWGVPGSL